LAEYYEKQHKSASYISSAKFPCKNITTYIHSKLIAIIKLIIRHRYVIYVINSGPAEIDNDWSGRTSGFYGRYFQKEAQKDYRVSSGVLLKIEVGMG